MTIENPYSAPLELSELVDNESVTDATDGKSLVALAKSVFLTWEKLRLLYIAILAVVSLLGIAFSMWANSMWANSMWANSMYSNSVGGNPSPLSKDVPYLVTLFFGAIFANVCYFAGPVVETYVRWLGFRTYWLRVCLFAVGTILASFLAIVALVGLSG